MDPSEYFGQPPLLYNFLKVTVTPPPPLVPQMGVPAKKSSSDLMELQKQHLQLFWQHQMMEMDHLAVYRQHQLPLARIKKVMKQDKSVKMISADAPILFAKACELFILDLTIRSWLRAEDNRRQNILRADIANAVSHADEYDFLVHVIAKNIN